MRGECSVKGEPLGMHALLGLSHNHLASILNFHHAKGLDISLPLVQRPDKNIYTQ
ncbi:jg9186, partial [Pararge aegeria aegeria]